MIRNRLVYEIVIRLFMLLSHSGGYGSGGYGGGYGGGGYGGGHGYGGYGGGYGKG